jgi:predicted N-acetyltransferase YhbS
MDIIIRHENTDEYRIVEELTREAFWNLYVPGCDEHFCLHNMRNHADFIPELDFVAEIDGKIVGNIVYTRGKIIEGTGKMQEVISFGPVSVLPAFQRQGIGGALIKHSLEKARAAGFSIVCIYGDPRYYHRFGFRCAEKYDIQNSAGKYAFALLTLELMPEALQKISGRFVESTVCLANNQAFQEYEASFPQKEKMVKESQAEFKILASLVY